MGNDKRGGHDGQGKQASAKERDPEAREKHEQEGRDVFARHSPGAKAQAPTGPTEILQQCVM